MTSRLDVPVGRTKAGLREYERMHMAVPCSIFQAVVRRIGASSPVVWPAEGTSWYLNATFSLVRCLRSTVYSPLELVGGSEMKAGFGATFSSLSKPSRRMVSCCCRAEAPALCTRPISPMTTLRMQRPCSNEAETVSMIEAFKPGAERSVGCFEAPWDVEEDSERLERML